MLKDLFKRKPRKKQTKSKEPAILHHKRSYSQYHPKHLRHKTAIPQFNYHLFGMDEEMLAEYRTKQFKNWLHKKVKKIKKKI